MSLLMVFFRQVYLVYNCCECRLIKEFEREIKDLKYMSDAHTSKILNEKKQSMVHSLVVFIALSVKGIKGFTYDMFFVYRSRS